jgi:hypothetical protein
MKTYVNIQNENSINLASPRPTNQEKRAPTSTRTRIARRVAFPVGGGSGVDKTTNIGTMAHRPTHAVPAIRGDSRAGESSIRALRSSVDSTDVAGTDMGTLCRMILRLIATRNFGARLSAAQTVFQGHEQWLGVTVEGVLKSEDSRRRDSMPGLEPQHGRSPL